MRAPVGTRGTLGRVGVRVTIGGGGDVCSAQEALAFIEEHGGSQMVSMALEENGPWED